MDSIRLPNVLNINISHGVQEKYINIIKETYTEGTAQIKTEKLSERIKIMKGVRQGDTLSPVMFTAAVENIFMRMNIETGININGVGLSNLRFADDIILFAESEDKLKEMLEELNNEGKKDGMKLNKKKTKIMCNEVARRRPRTGVKIDAEQLEEVTEYKYLGRLITSGNELSKEIGERITSGWRRFGDYSHFLRDKKIPTCLKKENHGYGHLTSYDLWSRDMDFNKTSREEACCSPTKHGEIVIEHHKERQDQERDNKIENRGDRYNRKSEVHERTVGRTCSQNEEHQVGENNIRVDTQRWKTTKRKTQKEVER